MKQLSLFALIATFAIASAADKCPEDPISFMLGEPIVQHWLPLQSPSPWCALDGDTYKFSDGARASMFCAQLNATLPVFRNTADMRAMAEFARTHTPFMHRYTSPEIFIGLHRTPDTDEWVWTDGSKPTFFHWAVGQPQILEGEDTCVTMSVYNKFWTTDRCDAYSPRFFTCVTRKL